MAGFAAISFPIGYVSGNFCSDPPGYLLAPALLTPAAFCLPLAGQTAKLQRQSAVTATLLGLSAGYFYAYQSSSGVPK